MTNYKTMIETLKKMIEDNKDIESNEKEDIERQIKAYEYLNTLDKDDICAIFDTRAFHDFFFGYLDLITKNLIKDEKMTEDQADTLHDYAAYYVSDTKAKSIIENYESKVKEAEESWKGVPLD